MSRGARPRPCALVAGLALVALGALLLLDATGILALGFAWLAPVVCGVLGATLLAAGLARRA